mgnify:CR=1 FL=1
MYKKVLGLTGLLSLAALLYVGINSFKGEAYQLNSVGRDIDSERNREVIWVYNSDNVAHEVGDVVVWFDGSTQDDGIEISTTTTANNGLVAGVVALYDIPATSWGFIQTRGYHSGVTIGVSNSAGDSLVTSGTGEASGVYSLAQSTGSLANQAQIYGVFAVALEATSSSTTVKAILRQ